MTNAHAGHPRRIAYFSMEVGIKAQIPIYSGGLGVLAGDTIRAGTSMGIGRKWAHGKSNNLVSIESIL
jgi:glycogen phosphorylase